MALTMRVYRVYRFLNLSSRFRLAGAKSVNFGDDLNVDLTKTNNVICAYPSPSCLDILFLSCAFVVVAD